MANLQAKPKVKETKSEKKETKSEKKETKSGKKKTKEASESKSSDKNETKEKKGHTTSTTIDSAAKFKTSTTRKDVVSAPKTEHKTRNSETHSSKKPEQPAFYENPVLGSLAIVLLLGVGFVLSYLISRLFARYREVDKRIDSRKNEIRDIELRLSQSGGIGVKPATLPPTIDNNALAERLTQLEDRVAELARQSKALLPSSPQTPPAGPTSASVPNLAPAAINFLYAELNQDQINKSIFKAGDKGQFTRIRLKEQQGGLYQFGLDPDLTSGQLDEVLTKQKHLEPFAEFTPKADARRAETRQAGQARRLPNGMFEVIQKAIIDFI